MDLEGLASWQSGRSDGYEELAAAIAFEDERAGGRERKLRGAVPGQ